MAAWWSMQANGKTVFYKLREHLANYFKVWSDNRKAKESMVASLPVRERNYNRLCSIRHIAHVLPAAPHNQPGVLILVSDVEMDTASSMSAHTENITSVVPRSSNEQTQPWQQMFHVLEPLETGSMFVQTGNFAPGSSVFQQRQMSVQPMEFETPIHSIPAHTSISQASVSIAGSSTPSSSDFITWTKEKQKCRCAVCVQNGRDGSECPGERDRKKCKFLQVSI